MMRSLIIISALMLATGAMAKTAHHHPRAVYGDWHHQHDNWGWGPQPWYPRPAYYPPPYYPQYQPCALSIGPLCIR